MVNMETRMERYAKYREQIKRMPASGFPSRQASSDNPESTAKQVPEQPAFSYEEEGFANGLSKNSPYSIYARKKRINFLIKILVTAFIIGLFVAWWFLLQGRRP